MTPFSDITPHVRMFAVGAFGLLGVASIAWRLIAWTHPQKDYSELRSRVRSWWVMAILLFGCLLLNRGLATVFLAFISFLAFREYISLIPTRRADRRVLFWAFLAIPIQYYWTWVHWYEMFVVFIPVFVFLALPLRMVTIGDTKDFLRAMGTLHWGVMSAVFSLSHLAYLIALPESTNPMGGGPGLVLSVIFLTQINDVAQFIWGKSFGRHKVIPKVSPNKTWEGLIGGVLTTTALAWWILPQLTPIPEGSRAMIAGLILGIGGFFGDVIISAIKRDIGVKDFGSILPGHGGILDRVDSLMVTAPIFFHLIHYWYY